MRKINLQKNKGFVLLFAVTLVAILLSIALGVATVAFKEVKFSTSAKDSNNAFFAADTGIECALFGEKLGNVFVANVAGVLVCNGENMDIQSQVQPDIWQFAISGLGSDGNACVEVTVDKTGTCQDSTPERPNCIISKGYNKGGAVFQGTCGVLSSNSGVVERQLEVRY